MEGLRGLAACLAMEDTGIYPKSFDGKERTEWQDGWNACAMETGEKARTVQEWLEALPARVTELIRSQKLRVSVRGDAGPELYVLCNDLFWWGVADGEGFELTDMPDFEQALKETAKLGDLLWVARKRGMRPQKPYYEAFSDEEAKLFDACGPERDE